MSLTKYPAYAVSQATADVQTFTDDLDVAAVQTLLAANQVALDAFNAWGGVSHTGDVMSSGAFVVIRRNG